MTKTEKELITLTFNTNPWQSEFIMFTVQSIRSTRPDTRQDSRGRLGRGRYTKTARNKKKLGRMDGRTNTARCRVASPRLKTKPDTISGLTHIQWRRFNTTRSDARFYSSRLGNIFWKANSPETPMKHENSVRPTDPQTKWQLKHSLPY